MSTSRKVYPRGDLKALPRRAAKFFLRQLKDIRRGGLPVLRRRIRAFPRWFSNNPYYLMLSSYGYKLAAVLRPNNAGIQLKIGILLNRLNRGGEAVTYLKNAVFLQPGSAPAQAELAETFVRLGRFDEGFTAWEKAFQLEPLWYTKVQNAFYYCGQVAKAGEIMQRSLDAINNFAREHQLDQLGIRFLSEYCHAIGHIGLLDLYVKMGMQGHRSTDHPVPLVAGRAANPSYLDYWRRYFPDIITDPLSLYLVSPFAGYLEDHISAVMNASGKQTVAGDYIGNQEQVAVQARWEAEGRGSLLDLKDADRKRGQQSLQALGVPADAWYVGMHVRGGHEKTRSARDADVRTYRQAMEAIAARGGWVIFMGDPATPLLPPLRQVIDYAHSQERSDWMDVFLWASCRFFIGIQSGPHVVPPTFGVPCIMTNWSSLGTHPWFSQDLYIFKLHWLEKEKRYLNFNEVLSSPIGLTESLEYLQSMGIKLVDNTPEEIRDITLEMLDRQEGKLDYTKDDRQLQKRFDQVCLNNGGKANARVGRDFLRKWAHLL